MAKRTVATSWAAKYSAPLSTITVAAFSRKLGPVLPPADVTNSREAEETLQMRNAIRDVTMRFVQSRSPKPTVPSGTKVSGGKALVGAMEYNKCSSDVPHATIEELE